MQFSDFASPAFYENPYPLYDRLRSAGTLIALGPGMSVTGDHALISAILKDRRLGRAYLQGVKLRYGEVACEAPAFKAWSRMMLLMNPPAHTHVRSALAHAFSVRRLEELSDLVQQVADELIDDFHGIGTTDLMKNFALPLPMRVICRLLDLPYSDATMLVDTSRALLQTLELAPMPPAQQHAAHEAALEMQNYFAAIVRRRRAEPGTDLISCLLLTEVEGERLADEDLIANVMLLFMAGYETTAGMIGNMLIALHRHPEQWSKFVSRPELNEAAVSECLRYDSSVQLAMRVALEDVQVAGHDIPRGHMVYLLLGAANRDPAVFKNPELLDIERPDHESKIVTFGGGIHHCLGARLAQMELQVALRLIASRLPDLRLDLDGLKWLPRHTLRGVEELHGYWTVDRHPSARALQREQSEMAD